MIIPPSNLINTIDQKIADLVKDIDNQNNENNIELYERKIDKLLEVRATLTSGEDSKSLPDILNDCFKPSSNNPNQRYANQALITNAREYLYLLRKSTQSLENKITKDGEMNKINDPALGLELFRTYRSIIEHEGTLLNERINWFFVTQAFLLAGVGAAMGAEFTIISPVFIIIISFIGCVYSCLVRNPILLSIEAVDILKREWREEIYGKMKDKDDCIAITRQVKNLLPLQVCFDSETYREYIRYAQEKTNKISRKTYEFNSDSENFKGNIKTILNVSFFMWLIIGILVFLYLRSPEKFSVDINSNRLQSYLTIETHSKNDQNTFINHINDQDTSYRAKLCPDKSSKTQNEVVVIYEAGQSTPYLSKQVDDSYRDKVNNDLQKKLSTQSNQVPELIIKQGRLDECNLD